MMNDHDQDESAPKQFIQGAIKRKGALTKKATAAHETPMSFARQHADAPGLTGQQARFAETLSKIRRKAGA